ncbi:hypothetical protein [uncultured Tateyamaria sp.]|uniref:DUF6916 family protein n=1 Tax=uncultured Tateyamaria sp. TaxID=455651 RepID=UPI0026075363|nr:hypothetical protein [uncultured Tateyamaria sp.]
MTFDPMTAAPQDFDAYVGDRFEVRAETGPVTLMLDNVKIFEGSTIRDNIVVIDDAEIPPRKAFALTFEGPVQPVLASTVYAMTHPALGDMDLFLSPFRQDRDCMLYEAVFN